MKKLANLLFLLIGLTAYSQETFNLDFEMAKDGFPVGWQLFGSEEYTVSLDSTDVQRGSRSAMIAYDGDKADFKAWSYTIPANYDGQKIKLTGYMKTENVEGSAGLWMRIDPQVAFDNMQDRAVTGTTGWKQYEIELDLNPNKATQIVLGGLLVGKGKIWLDNLRVTIDGADLKDAKPKELLPAAKDTAFNSGSEINFPELDAQLITDLEILGKVWGFLKYYHPAIARGAYNWDYELFRMLPAYLENEGAAARDQLLLDWIKQLGEVPECKDCTETAENAFLKPDLAWITAGDLSQALQEQLLHIQKNRNQGDHYYLSPAPYVGNPRFENEAGYQNMPYPDTGFRLLALYRYWNMIQYFFPYKHQIDKPWNEQLRAYLPKFLEAEDELAYELAAVQLIGDVQDTHANLWGGNNAINEWKGKYYAPVHVRFVENQLAVTDYYNPELKEKVGLEIGDVITRINGEEVGDIVERLGPFYPASNQPTRLRDISADLLRANDREIEISYVRDQEEMTTKLSLYEADSLNIYRWYRRDNEKSYKMLDDNIGYITLKSIKQEDIEPIKETFKDTKGIIIDIRNYPSTFVPFLLGSYFVSDTTAFVKFTSFNLNNPGEFTFGENLDIPNAEETYRGKLVVLVNELSQSQAEYTAMAFRAGDNTTIIGSTTAGADGNVSTILLPGGMRTMISGIGVFYPDGTETQKVGIVPDITVNPTVEGIRKGKDELLLKAIEVIKQ